VSGGEIGEEAFDIPMAAPTGVALQDARTGAIPVRITNTLASPRFIAAQECGQSIAIANIAAASSRTILALPATRLWTFDAISRQQLVVSSTFRPPSAQTSVFRSTQSAVNSSAQTQCRSSS